MLQKKLIFPSVLMILASITTLGLWLVRGWIWIGVPHFDTTHPPFTDAYAQLVTAEQCRAGIGEWIHGACFVPSVLAITHAQTYEPWLIFSRWGLGTDHYELISALMIGFFYLAFTLTMKPRNFSELWICFFLLFSASIQLCVERANFDLLMSGLICLSAWLLAKPRILTAVAGCVVLSFATMLKIYTGLACTLAWAVARFLRISTFIAAISATVIAISVLGPDTILTLGHGAPEGSTRFSTGAHWLFRYRGLSSALITVWFALVSTGTGFYFLRKIPVPLFIRWPNRTTAFNIAFLVAIPLFFLKDSYDYRMVLWLPTMALPLAWTRGNIHYYWRRLAISTLALYFVVVSSEFLCFWLDELIRQANITWTTPIISFLIYIKQAAVWLLVSVLSLIFGFGLIQKFPRFSHVS